MPRRLPCWSLVPLLAAALVSAQAQERPGVLPDVPPERPGQLPPPKEEPTPAALPAEPACTRLVPLNRALLVEEQKAVAVPVLRLRECVAREPVLTPTVDYKKERQRVTVMTVKPRTEERLVVRRRPQAVTTCDPVTGQPCTKYELVPVEVKIQVTVYDCVPEEKVVAVQVPRVQEKPQEVLVKTYNVDPLTVPGVEKRYRALILPGEVGCPECQCCPPPALPAPAPCAAPACPRH